MIPEDRDAPERAQARAAQDDPWVMYLVVRYDAPATRRAVLCAAARATMDCVARHGTSSAWREAFEAWAARSFRKVSLRARGAAWARIGAMDHGEAGVDGEALVRVLPPRLRSTCEALVRNLQVYNPDAAAMPEGDPAPDPDAMTFALNPDARMSLGKAVAQVSHAVLLAAWRTPLDDHHREALARWHRRAWPCHLADPDAWSSLRALPIASVVRDAGLTEVAPGTETVLAVPPLAR